jgi:hypothetical protein
MLKERLNRALEIYHHSEHKPQLLVSGGQGPDFNIGVTSSVNIPAPNTIIKSTD